MNEPNAILGIFNIAWGLLLILLSIPLVAKKVPMNRFYGFRVRKAFESEANWYDINRYGGRQLIHWALLLMVIGALYFTFPTDGARSREAEALLAVGPIIICPAVAVLKTLLYSKQL